MKIVLSDKEQDFLIGLIEILQDIGFEITVDETEKETILLAL
jgi:hypothetical protein